MLPSGPPMSSCKKCQHRLIQFKTTKDTWFIGTTLPSCKLLAMCKEMLHDCDSCEAKYTDLNGRLNLKPTRFL